MSLMHDSAAAYALLISLNALIGHRSRRKGWPERTSTSPATTGTGFRCRSGRSKVLLLEIAIQAIKHGIQHRLIFNVAALAAEEVSSVSAVFLACKIRKAICSAAKAGQVLLRALKVIPKAGPAAITRLRALIESATTRSRVEQARLRNAYQSWLKIDWKPRTRRKDPRRHRSWQPGTYLP